MARTVHLGNLHMGGLKSALHSRYLFHKILIPGRSVLSTLLLGGTFACAEEEGMSAAIVSTEKAPVIDGSLLDWQAGFDGLPPKVDGEKAPHLFLTCR